MLKFKRWTDILTDIVVYYRRTYALKSSEETEIKELVDIIQNIYYSMMNVVKLNLYRIIQLLLFLL